MKLAKSTTLLIMALVCCVVSARAACTSPPVNPDEASPDAILKSAGPLKWILLSLGSPTNISITGPSLVTGSVNPAAGVAAVGNLSISGSSVVNVAGLPDVAGLYLNQGAKLSQSGSGGIIGNIYRGANIDVKLNQARADALAGSQLAQSWCNNTVLGPNSINIGGGHLDIYGSSSVNVLNLKDLIMNGGATITLHSPPGNFIVNVTGKFSINGGSKIFIENTLSELNVLFNVVGTGEQVAMTGGSDNGVPKSEISGTLLAPQRDIALSPGFVHGAVIGGGSQIAIVSGSYIVSKLQ